MSLPRDILNKNSNKKHEYYLGVAEEEITAETADEEIGASAAETGDDMYC